MSGKRIYSYKVAELTFMVAAQECYDIEELLPSFAAFRVADVASALRQARRPDKVALEDEPEMLFRFTLQYEAIEVPAGAVMVEEDDNDMGHTRLGKTWDGSYYLELGYHDRGLSGKSHDGIFIATPDFSRISASIATESPDCGPILTSMLRIAFAQAVILRDGISIHASAVAADGKAFLFLGKSGTGKSTHARMWLRNIQGSHLLNDDNPAIRLIDGKPVAFGTPWSGKTPCYRNESCPVGGIVRLVQSDADIFMQKKDVAAFVALLPSCSVVHSDSALQARLCDTIAKIIELVPVGELKCLPDNESAIICYNNFKSLIK